MLTVCDLRLTPEEVETLDMSPVCSGCGHRYAFHERETSFCLTNGCCCSWFEEE